MSAEIAIKVENLSKYYEIYDHPRDRLKQFLLPSLQRALGQQAKPYYREFWALKDLSFEIRKGETVGIIGRNGSGKSTLLQMICGTLNPSGGNIATQGRIAALLELGAGFNPEFSGRENVYMNGALLGLSHEEINTRFDEITAFAEIGDFIEQPVKTYSSGMVVRLAFAVAIHVEPQILIVDEALSVGDELFQRKCFSRIEAIRASGATILFVSHSGGTVVELCDRAILLDSGELLAIGEPKQMVGRYQKLLYAPPEKRAFIRNEIKHHQENSDISGKESPAITQASRPETTTSPPPLPELSDYYDPGLKPSSTLSYESYGAYIEDPAIYTLSGEPVNYLTRGKTYRYRYRVRFDQAVSNVRFGMLLKTLSGVELGGAASAASNRNSIPFVESNRTVEIEFEFVCRLNAGVYFMNAGVVGDLKGSETYLHRLIDAVMFRVLSESNHLGTGLVDFSCTPKIKPL